MSIIGTPAMQAHYEMASHVIKTVQIIDKEAKRNGVNPDAFFYITAHAKRGGIPSNMHIDYNTLAGDMGKHGRCEITDDQLRASVRTFISRLKQIDPEIIKNANKRCKKPGVIVQFATDLFLALT